MARYGWEYEGRQRRTRAPWRDPHAEHRRRPPPPGAEGPESRPYIERERTPDFRGERRDLEHAGRGWPYGVGYEEGKRAGYPRYGRDYTRERPPATPGRPGRASRARGAGSRNDRELEQRVRERITRDTWIDPRDVHIDVHDGVVTLEGSVRDYMEARFAWDDAWETPGVRGVVSRLRVRA